MLWLDDGGSGWPFYACNTHLSINWASKAHLKQNAITKYVKAKLFPDKLSLCCCIHQQNLSTEANLDAECEKLHRGKN